MFLTPDAQQLVYETTTAALGQIGAVMLAAGVLVWSSANVAIDFQTVLERIENTDEDRSSSRLRDGGLVLGSLCLAIVSIVLISILFSLLPFGPFVAFAGLVVLFDTLTAAFLLLYYLPSRLLTAPLAALPGALTAAFGWVVLHGGILFFTRNAAAYAIYGVLSGIVIIPTSLYIAAFVLMTGIAINTIFATDTDSRNSSGSPSPLIDPSESSLSALAVNRGFRPANETVSGRIYPHLDDLVEQRVLRR